MIKAMLLLFSSFLESIKVHSYTRHEYYYTTELETQTREGESHIHNNNNNSWRTLTAHISFLSSTCLPANLQNNTHLSSHFSYDERTLCIRVGLLTLPSPIHRTHHLIVKIVSYLLVPAPGSQSIVNIGSYFYYYYYYFGLPAVIPAGQYSESKTLNNCGWVNPKKYSQ